MSTIPFEDHPVTESGTGAAALADGPGARSPDVVLRRPMWLLPLEAFLCSKDIPRYRVLFPVLPVAGDLMVRPPHSIRPKAVSPVQHPSTPECLVQDGADNNFRELPLSASRCLEFAIDIDSTENFVAGFGRLLLLDAVARAPTSAQLMRCTDIGGSPSVKAIWELARVNG